MKLHLKFRHIEEGAVTAAKEFFAAHPWKDDFQRSSTDEPRATIFQNFLNAASAVYGVTPPTFQIAFYNSGYHEHVISMPRYSVLRLFSGFRRYLIEAGAVTPNLGASNERDDAHAWACSLWYAASPITFRKSVRSRLIRGVHADDLLTQATIDAREVARREENARLEAEAAARRAVRGISYQDNSEFTEDTDAPSMSDVVGEGAESGSPFNPASAAPRPDSTWLSANGVATQAGRSHGYVMNHISELGGQRNASTRFLLRFPPSAVVTARGTTPVVTTAVDEAEPASVQVEPDEPLYDGHTQVL